MSDEQPAPVVEGTVVDEQPARRRDLAYLAGYAAVVGVVLLVAAWAASKARRPCPDAAQVDDLREAAYRAGWDAGIANAAEVDGAFDPATWAQGVERDERGAANGHAVAPVSDERPTP